MTLGNLFRIPYHQQALLPSTKRRGTLKLLSGFIFFFGVSIGGLGQLQSSDVVPVSIENDGDFSGYDILDTPQKQLFVLAEHWHNIKMVPQATLKVLRFLHEESNVRILAIEHGKSVAFMINEYLRTGEEEMLQHITRNTMFWGMENRKFFENLRSFNQTLPAKDQIVVKSIDIEYKQEAAIFMINRFIGQKEIPGELSSTVGEFQRIYLETLEHRESPRFRLIRSQHRQITPLNRPSFRSRTICWNFGRSIRY